MSEWRTTRWTMIQGLAHREDPEAYQKAWEHLVERYKPFFLRYAGWCLRRMGGHTLAANEAEEVVAAFLVDCLEKDWLARARRDKGRFRTFASTVLARYTRDWMERRRAKKRMPESGPPAHVEDLAAMVGAAEAESIEEEMDREWTEHLIGLALAATRGRSRKNAVAIETLMATPDADRAVLAAKLEVQERQVPVNLHRARRMFAEELWEQVKETCSSQDDFLDERSALRPWLEHYLDPETSLSLYGDPTET